MDPRNSKQSICNKHGIRVYPVLQYGTYYLEVEFNRTSDFNPRYIKKDKEGNLQVYRGKQRFDTGKKKLWASKIEEMYEELYEKNVKPKLKKNHPNH